MLNIVTIDGKRYMVDVGFGSAGPTHPLLLEHDDVSTNVGEQEIRLVHGNIPDLTDPRQRLWQYEHRNKSNDAWIPTYCFTELEFTPSDFMIMNHFTSTHRTSWFTTMVVCVKMVMVDGEIVGDVTLSGADIKKRIRGRSELLAHCASEDERVDALEKHLGVVLNTSERHGISGMVSALL